MPDVHFSRIELPALPIDLCCLCSNLCRSVSWQFHIFHNRSANRLLSGKDGTMATLCLYEILGLTWIWLQNSRIHQDLCYNAVRLSYNMLSSFYDLFVLQLGGALVSKFVFFPFPFGNDKISQLGLDPAEFLVRFRFDRAGIQVWPSDLLPFVGPA